MRRALIVTSSPKCQRAFRTAKRVRHALHDVALFLAALSALLYLAAATGLWVEHAETADVFGCARHWAVNAHEMDADVYEMEVNHDAP